MTPLPVLTRAFPLPLAAGIVPRGENRSPAFVLTMQKLWLKGSDVFFALTEMRSNDLGRTWMGPYEHTDTLGRPEEPGGVIVAASDFWPKWHAKSPSCSASSTPCATRTTASTAPR